MAADGAEVKYAMPDGKFTIVDSRDLIHSINAWQHADNKDAVKKHIIERAKEMGKTSLLPDGWIEKSQTYYARDYSKKIEKFAADLHEPISVLKPSMDGVSVSHYKPSLNGKQYTWRWIPSNITKDGLPMGEKFPTIEDAKEEHPNAVLRNSPIYHGLPLTPEELSEYGIANDTDTGIEDDKRRYLNKIYGHGSHPEPINNDYENPIVE